MDLFCTHHLIISIDMHVYKGYIAKDSICGTTSKDRTSSETSFESPSQPVWHGPC
jgi:hypothetical protein